MPLTRCAHSSCLEWQPCSDLVFDHDPLPRTDRASLVTCCVESVPLANAPVRRDNHTTKVELFQSPAAVQGVNAAAPCSRAD
jgi:hypothetical protein